MENTNSPVDSQQMQWMEVPDIDEVKPYNVEDEACFKEVRDVLVKHGALERFGLSLIHRHFDVAEDEVMVEWTDIDNRTLTIKPVKKEDARHQDLIVTNWKLTEGDIVAQVGCTCGRTHQGHNGGHMNV